MLLNLLALARLDSINPSAIVVTIYLLGQRRIVTPAAVYVAAPTSATPAPPAAPQAATYAAVALLGVTVTAMELPTAVPYFAAIALLASAELPTPQWRRCSSPTTSSSSCLPFCSSWGTSSTGSV
jgi:hypothetical protein